MSEPPDYFKLARSFRRQERKKLREQGFLQPQTKDTAARSSLESDLEMALDMALPSDEEDPLTKPELHLSQEQIDAIVRERKEAWAQRTQGRKRFNLEEELEAIMELPSPSQEEAGASHDPPLTEEQQRRMEVNRQKALARKKQKQATAGHVDDPPTLTPEQQRLAQENRARAQQRKQEKLQQRLTLPASRGPHFGGDPLPGSSRQEFHEVRGETLMSETHLVEDFIRDAEGLEPEEYWAQVAARTRHDLLGNWRFSEAYEGQDRVRAHEGEVQSNLRTLQSLSKGSRPNVAGQASSSGNPAGDSAALSSAAGTALCEPAARDEDLTDLQPAAKKQRQEEVATVPTTSSASSSSSPPLAKEAATVGGARRSTLDDSEGEVEQQEERQDVGTAPAVAPTEPALSAAQLAMARLRERVRRKQAAGDVSLRHDEK